MCFRANVSSTDVSVFDELILFLLFLKRAEEWDEDDMVAIDRVISWKEHISWN